MACWEHQLLLEIVSTGREWKPLDTYLRRHHGRGSMLRIVGKEALHEEEGSPWPKRNGRYLGNFRRPHFIVRKRILDAVAPNDDCTDKT